MYTRKDKGMTRKNTLVDYGNLAANVFQAVQLSQVRRGIDTQTQIAATELAVEENQGRLCESIFQYDSLLRNLQGAHARNQNVVGVLALARESLLNMKCNRISHLLRAYADKEKLRDVEEGFEALAHDCSASLSAQERDEAELCAQYRTEESYFDAAIFIKETNLQLDDLRDKLEATQLPGQNWANSVALVAGFGLVVGIIAFCVGQDSPQMRETLDQVSAWAVGIAALAWVIAMIMALARWSRRHSIKQAETLSTRIEQLEHQCLAKAFEAGDRIARWKNKTLAELQQARQERTTLIEKILTTKRLQTVTQ